MDSQTRCPFRNLPRPNANALQCELAASSMRWMVTTPRTAPEPGALQAMRGYYPTPPATVHVSVHVDWPSHCSGPLTIPSPQ